MNTEHASPRGTLMRMLIGNQLQQAIHVAARLGIPDLLADGSRTADELARSAGANATALRRLLRSLASFGVFAEESSGAFALTATSALLRRNVPGSLHSFALWSGGDRYAAFGDLEYSVRTGRPAFERVTGTEFWTYLDRHPDAAAIFDEMMSSNTAPLAPLVAQYDFGDADVVVDVGGGRGELIAAILRARPELCGILVDHPRVMAEAKRVLEAAGVADRCGTVCGDLLASVPSGARAYLLKSVLHGLDDDTATRVLGNCRRAIHENGKLLLVEFVLPSANEPSPGWLMDLLMLIGCRGHERTAEEFRALLDAARFRLADLSTTKFGYSFISATPA